MCQLGLWTYDGSVVSACELLTLALFHNTPNIGIF